MKKALIVLAVVAATCASTFAQSSTVIFKNRNVSTPDNNPTLPNGSPNPNYIPGGNANGSFNIPIYAAGGVTSGGAGLLPGGVTIGLFYQGNQLGTAVLGTTANSSPFMVTPPNQELQIKDAAGNIPAPGSTPTLVIRAWQTSAGSFDNAKAGAGQYGEWTFNAPPISGAGSPPSTAPDLYTWGNINGTNPTYGNGGLSLVPEPSTIALGVLGVGALVLARRRK